MRKNKLLIITLAVILLLVSCSGKSGEQKSKQQKPPQSPESGESQQDGGGQGKEEEKSEPHEYIKDAKKVTIDQIETDKLDISDVVFVGEKKIAVACPKDIGEKKSFLYDMEAKQAVKLPDNTTVIKKLENDDLFVRTGNEGSYAILDGASYTVKKAINRPETVDPSLDISPDGKLLAYVTSEGLFAADTDFQNPVKLVDAKKEQDVFRSLMPRYPMWLDNSRISYKMLGWEHVMYCGVVLRNGSENKVYENAKDSSIYPLISGDFISRGEYGRGVGLIDGITGEKKTISPSVIEYEGFAYDKNGKWVVFFMTNKETTEEIKWTGKLEIRSVQKGEKVKEFKSEKPNTMPVEDAVASPDGKLVLFTDLDKTGRRVLYKLEINMEEQSEGGSGS